MPNTPTGLDYSLKAEELAAQHTALKGRLIALAAVVPLIGFIAPWPAPLFTYVMISLLALSGWCAWRIQQSQWTHPAFQYAFVLLDCIVITFSVLYPNPLQPQDFPPQFYLRFGTFIYFFILLAELAYSYRPHLVLWGGVCIAACWSFGVWILLRLPNTLVVSATFENRDETVIAVGDLGFIDMGVRVQEVVMILVIALLLSLAVRRSRAVVLRQAKLAQERTNLARYFPAKTAELLAGRSNPFSTPREHACAVMFADLVGFTKWSEQQNSPAVIALLRQVHGMIAQIVFKHGGTLDKFMGDGVMATFGTPDPTGRDASNALAAMVDIAESFEAWTNDPDNKLGQDLNLAIGVHFGTVVIGDIGSAQRLEFAVLGDTVNVASRLETATRNLACRCVVSDALIEAARQESAEASEHHIDRLILERDISLKGRVGKMDVYMLR